MIELGLLAFTIAGFLVLLDRRDKRQHEQAQAHRVEQAGLVARFEKQLREHRSEVATLCQRIQAPEHAVVEHAQTGVPSRPAVNPMSDEEYWQAQEEQREMLKEIDRLEREGFDITPLVSDGG